METTESFIILDMDGVVNYRSQRSAIYKARDNGDYNIGGWATPETIDQDRFAFDQIDAERVARVQSIATETNATIVISSDWRIHFTLDKLREWLKAKGLITPIIGATSELILGEDYNIKFSARDHGRLMEIEHWILTNVSTEKLPSTRLVILEDDWPMGRLERYCVRTFDDEGLTNKGVAKAIKILKSFPPAGIRILKNPNEWWTKKAIQTLYPHIGT